MGSPRLSTPELRVVMADGTEYPKVQALNVDLVSWDRDRVKHGWPSPSDAPFVWLNYVAWHVLRREGMFPGTLREFEEAAIEVSSRADDDGEPAGVDPTSVEAEPG
jgi:hypothetical protein